MEIRIWAVPTHEKLQIVKEVVQAVSPNVV